ncbi:MAG: YbhB/YbcL family Raf kinase inhibitor-like protein [Terriglobales bacterium]
MTLLLAAVLSFGLGVAPSAPARPQARQHLRLASTSFRNLQPIPLSHTCDGTERTSAELHWSGAPRGTRSFVLIMFDPDARPPRGFVHWVVYDIPAGVHAIPSGRYNTAALPGGGTEGNNGRGQLGFVPSCPPPGPAHHYTFTLYALRVPSLHLPPGATRAQVRAALRGKVLARVHLVGLYAGRRRSR